MSSLDIGNPSDYTSPSKEVASQPDLDQAQKDADLVSTWIRELGLAAKREKNFRKDGREIVALYESEREERHQFNILYSNTETLAPAMYNTTPRPVVQRRFKDADELGQYASQAAQRVLEFLIDPGESENSSFDSCMQSAVLEALLPGRGVTWFKYEPTWDDDEEQNVVEAETVCGEEVPWERFRHGYAKKWPQVPWVSREHLLTKEEAVSMFGQEIAQELKYTETKEGGDDVENGGGQGQKDDSTKGAKLCQVFEIWDKATKTVLFIATCYKDKPCKVVDDPLKLQAFFPCPMPLRFIQTVSSLTPVALYKTYKSQAEELNLITVRINKLVAACKVRGMYDSTISGLADVLTASDNVLLPVDNVAALIANSMTLEKSIWLVPIDAIVGVLQQLYLAREQVKKTIYEITGIADIMRGSSVASETLGAQEIKNQWGTLRLKRAQKEVARYVRESLRIMAEIALTKFSEPTLSKMTGLPWPTGAQAVQAHEQAAQMSAIGQPVPIEVQAVISAPNWTELLGLLKDDITRSYRIDIETNSTVDAEATEDKQNITDLINAMAQFLNGVAPLVENGTMPFEVAKQMLLTIVRRFRFGPEMEDSLKAMVPPKPQPDPKAAAMQAKAQSDQQAAQLKLQHDQATFAMEKAKFQAEQAAGQQDAQLKMQMAQLELQIKQEEAQLRRQEMGQKMQLSAATHAQKMHEIQLSTQANLVTTHAKTGATLAQAAAKVKAANAPKPSPGGK